MFYHRGYPRHPTCWDPRCPVDRPRRDPTPSSTATRTSRSSMAHRRPMTSSTVRWSSGCRPWPSPITRASMASSDSRPRPARPVSIRSSGSRSSCSTRSHRIRGGSWSRAGGGVAAAVGRSRTALRRRPGATRRRRVGVPPRRADRGRSIRSISPPSTTGCPSGLDPIGLVCLATATRSRRICAGSVSRSAVRTSCCSPATGSATAVCAASSAGRTWPGPRACRGTARPFWPSMRRGSSRCPVAATGRSPGAFGSATGTGRGRSSKGYARLFGRGPGGGQPGLGRDGGDGARSGSSGRVGRGGRRPSGIAAAGFVLELEHHLLPDDDWLVAETARLAEEVGVPVVVTNDVHYATAEGRELQDVVTAIRHGRSVATLADLRRPDGESYLKSAAELHGPAAGRSDDGCRRSADRSGLGGGDRGGRRARGGLRGRSRVRGVPLPRLRGAGRGDAVLLPRRAVPRRRPASATTR